MRTAKFLILLVSLAAVITPRTLAAVDTVSATECDPNTLPTTTEQLQNPGNEPIAYLYAEGVRVFNCSFGVPSATSGGLVNITNGGLMGTSGAKTNWTGVGYYPDSEGNGTFALTEIDSQTGAPVGKEFFLTLDYRTVQFVPAPDGKSLSWARWDIFTVPRALQRELGIGWGSRVKTVGGEEPKDCSNIFVNNSVVFNYTAFYYFYPCPSISNTSVSNSSSSLAPSQEEPEVEHAEQQATTSEASLTSAPCMLLSVLLSVLLIAHNLRVHDVILNM
jgi:hypothetical protein